MPLPYKCSRCNSYGVLSIYHYGGPWLHVCADCDSKYGPKFRYSHYQYLFQVLVRAGLGLHEANRAIAKEIMQDGLTCYPASEGDLWDAAQVRTNEKGLFERFLGPMPDLEVSGNLEIRRVLTSND